MGRLSVVVLALAVSVPAAAFLVSTGDASHPGAILDFTIIRDEWGVPHIWATDSYDLLYANGYAQAQDRLAQMEILRHVAKGELASLTGPSGLPLDLVTRRELYTHEERVAALHALSGTWQNAFQAYTDGVNAWITEVRKDPAKLPVEYPALVVAPDWWAATDSIAIAQFLLDVFGRGGGGGEVGNAQFLAHLAATLPASAVEGAFLDHHWVQRNDTYTTIKLGDGAYPPLAAERALPLAELTADQLEATAAAGTAELVDDTDATLGEALSALGWPFRMGSNAQVIDESFAANGKPLLFGGPQMGYFTPMIPYELGLHGGGFDTVGMGVAGAPGVIIGRTATQSWTVTSGTSDQVDTVAERLVDFYHYEVDGQSVAMDCRNETHLVRPGPADFIPDPDPDWRPPVPDVVVQEVCRTVHGPVLYRTPDGAYAFASQRSYRGDEARSGTLWLQVGTTSDLTGFRALFEDFSFTFNFNYASEDGTIAYFHVGRQPLRDERLDPRLPRPGWDSSYEWQGVLQGTDLPGVVNPASGFTVNWNNNPAQGWPVGDQREHWGSSHRVEMMHETLAPVLAAGSVELDDLRAVNEYASTHEPFADEFSALWRNAAVLYGAPDAVAAIDAWAASGYDYADRDGDGFHDFPAFRLYELWRERFQVDVFGDELGNFTRTFGWDPPTSDDPHAADHGQHGNKDNVLLDAMAGTTSHAWCDDVATGAVETCLDQATEALGAALAGEPDWADPFPQRMIRFVALGAGPAYEIPMVNRPSFQHFYDWGEPEGPGRSRNVLPPGASGAMNGAEFMLLQGQRNGAPPPFGAVPPHLEDQLGLYVAFQDKPMLFAREWVEAFEESRIVVHK